MNTIANKKAESLKQRNSIFLETTAIPYYSVFQQDEDLIKIARKYPHLMYLPHILELVTAEGTKCDFIDAYGQDLNNKLKTDIKTVTLIQHVKSANSWEACVTGVKTKDGSIAIIISNPVENRCDYMHVPKNKLKSITCMNGTCIKIHYNSRTKNYSRLEQFRFHSWNEFCLSIGD